METLSPEQQKMLDEALEQLEAGARDAREDGGYDVDACWSDIVEAAAWDISDPVVRREFYRTQGCIDRQTGYDPMAGV